MKRNKRPGNGIYILKLTLSRKLWFVIFIPLLTILLAQKEVVTSWLSAQIFNKLQFVVEEKMAFESLKMAVFFSVLLFIVSICEWLISSISSLIENCWREDVDITLQKMFMKKDYRIDISDFDDPELQSRRSVAQSVDPVGQIKTLLTCIGKIISTVSFFMILWRYSPIMCFLAFIVKVPTYFVVNKINTENRDFRLSTDVVVREKNYFHNMPVDRGTIKEFKIFNIKDFVCDKYDQIVRRYYSVFKRKYVKNEASNSILENYNQIITIIVEIIVGVSVFNGEMLFGDYTLLIAAFINLSGSAENLIKFIAQFKDMHLQNNLLREYLEDSSIFESGEEKTVGVCEQRLVFEFKNVSFTYPGTDKEILHELNFTIHSGKTYALIGLNGSGKSTLVNLLLRLYEPSNGDILLNGVNIKEYNIHAYYEMIACVFQNTTHYAMSIKDFIAGGKGCDEKKIELSLKQVKLFEWCKSLPNKWETMLTRAFTTDYTSVEPSIGQWQKLAIARAIYKDAPVIVLDEPSASLDVDSENEIFKYISRLASKKTSLLISHRLSNIVESDCILVLQDGYLIEQGNHLELIEHNGVYRDLFISQSKYYKSEEE